MWIQKKIYNNVHSRAVSIPILSRVTYNYELSQEQIQNIYNLGGKLERHP